MAVDVLISKGVPEDHILFLNLIASPEGAKKFAAKYPKVRVVTAFVDQGLNERKYVKFMATSADTDFGIAISCQVWVTLAIGSTQYETSLILLHGCGLG